VTRTDLLAQGLTDDQIRGLLRSGRLRRQRPGVFAAPGGVAPEHLVAVGAAQLSVPAVVVSHRSAALAHGLPLARPWSRPEVTRTDSPCHLAGTLTHRYDLPERDVTSLGELRVTTVARTLVDIARVVPTAEALVPLDYALRHGLAAREDCWGVHARLRGVNFRWRVADTIAEGDPCSESALESFSRGQLRAQGIPRPHLQVELSGPEGQLFFADMYWPEPGIVGECDGRAKYAAAASGPDVLWREKLRQEWIESQGLGVLRWTWREVDRSPRALADRWRALARRRAGWQPAPGLTIGPSRAAA
jgi:hypothetical protein